MLDVRDEDNDTLDGCEIDFADHAVTDEEVALLPLFPDGVDDPAKAEQWKQLFANGQG